MGAMFRLGLVFLGIGTSLFLCEDACLWFRAMLQSFPQFGEWIFINAVGFLLFLLAQPLAEELHKVPACFAEFFRAMVCTVGLLLAWLGMIGGFMYCFLRNRKAKG